jgi:hypothetical protein
MDINLPDVLAEVTAEFAKYEHALAVNDVAALDEFFWRNELTLRYGVNEILYGHDAIAAFRAARPAQTGKRITDKTVITTYGRDYATTNIHFHREGGDKTGRQSQTWVRFPFGWRIVAAHVSLMLPPQG